MRTRTTRVPSPPAPRSCTPLKDEDYGGRGYSCLRSRGASLELRDVRSLELASRSSLRRSRLPTRHDLQLGRRLFHVVNGVTTATAYALLFTHEQVIHIFGTIACVVYVVDRVRIAYPEVVARRAPWVNRLLVRAEEQVRESAMIPYAIAVLLTILTGPEAGGAVAIYTLAIADPLRRRSSASRFGRRRIAKHRSVEGSAAFFVATLAIAAARAGRGGPTARRRDRAAAPSRSRSPPPPASSLPLRIDDNLTIPLVVGFATWIVAGDVRRAPRLTSPVPAR